MDELKHYWLVAGNVIAASPKGQVGQKGLNTMVTTDGETFTRAHIATAQEGLLQRFVKETPQDRGGKILDVFILSVSHLGLMTQKEFEGPFTQSTENT